MSETEILHLYQEFLKTYDAKAKDTIWVGHREKFRKFWKEKILSDYSGPIPETEIDEVVRVLDRNGKGNTKDSESVAKAMIAQGAWRRMFNEIHANKKLAELITGIFEAPASTKAGYVDLLYEINAGKRNNLTGQSGNAINAMLAAHDPFDNTSLISFNHRKMLIDYLRLPWTIDLDKASVGERMIESNKMIVDGSRSMGILESVRTFSQFCYYPPMMRLWKTQHTVRRPEGEIEVTVPANPKQEEAEKSGESEIRESLQMQALLAVIGTKMGLKIWLPKADRAAVLKKWKESEGVLLDVLPLNYDDTTLRTIEQIDVIWLRGKSIMRAFEVEHSTSVYSGLLRMADLLALQPNMKINLHIVAPAAKREKVFQEILRPVFALLDSGPLAETCTYISYDNLKDLAKEKHLEHLSPEVLDDYAEKAEAD